MATDHVLLEAVQAGSRPVLRLYRWRPACLSFGRNQPAAGLYDDHRAQALGIDLVRRPTGGLAVYHDSELTYSVSVPADRLGGPRAGYRSIHGALAAALTSLGVPASVSGVGPRHRSAAVQGGAASFHSPARGLEAGPCFADAVPGEVEAGGRKLVGSAQRTQHRTILQHGSILIHGDQSPAAALLRVAPPAPDCAGIVDFLGRPPDRETLEDAIVHGFTSTLSIDFERSTLSAAESSRMRELLCLYRSQEWTWRR